MKLTRIGKSFIIFFLLLTMILFFIQFTKKSDPLTDSKTNQSVSLPTELHPVVKERSNQLIQQSAKKGIVVVVTDGFRSAEEQDRLYDKGRTAEGSIVTFAKGGESYHNYGLAIDFALKTPSGNVIWDRQYDGNKNGKADWTEVVKMAKALGFEWGGDWAKFKDYPHLQMNFGLTIAKLQKGEKPAESSLTADTK
ncbi:Peptidoglycan L-alanyl-D-glutamate endopeptidase CwlK [Neobacillus rhizosphaerae]|uniref:Peptidoglycan L-alanyl-D-glutamate endopeptidase CwlK n=1 Tax=Neobacillus rhizosphaerae TaxID=2880965 RepID=A0ABM9EVL1_9BACI|nr:M15 family metallopeptidase [Neobacillus rhizosphaerae]CAH2716728.1 Peptidoglycan L-alanyl-D-glutamate endopeptidase CwlK [Neobacillus rhizosphaerae]